MALGKRSFLIWAPPLQICVRHMGMDETSREHGGSVRELHDPSKRLSASAAAGLMRAGERNGRADKAWALTESIASTALHLSLEGGWGGGAQKAEGDYFRKLRRGGKSANGCWKVFPPLYVTLLCAEVESTPRKRLARGMCLASAKHTRAL